MSTKLSIIKTSARTGILSANTMVNSLIHAQDKYAKRDNLWLDEELRSYSSLD